MDLNWHKSSYSGQHGGNCVEVAETPGAVYVRDTQNRDLGHVGVSGAAWVAFLEDVKTGAL
ncbi:uncharacterized protein DUF397 [Murinocardiopsis flavida]|uniref:Uncharacterized protein DUF397 n=1 Tax=Murinocardiopsis flavida TaxID=645275 RepID=A0A2P8C6V8_9ACTN|nr:DUF397 domain-containing protein [Murinocardiopsis flavida]PSK80700.1 uncharacterized protein DUF397 [Murinocardiopsis flavida]